MWKPLMEAAKESQNCSLGFKTQVAKVFTVQWLPPESVMTITDTEFLIFIPLKTAYRNS